MLRRLRSRAGAWCGALLTIAAPPALSRQESIQLNTFPVAHTTDVFRVTEGEAPKGFRIRAYPHPPSPGDGFRLSIRHKGSMRIQRVEVDLGDGTPQVHEKPSPRERGWTLVGFELPSDLDADSIRIVIRMPAASVLVALPVAPSPGRSENDLDRHFSELPEAVEKVPPVYPEEARRSRVDGTVTVLALVAEDGEVIATRVGRSIPLLDEAAMAAVRMWKFKTCQVDGEPAACWVTVPVRFSLH